MDGQGLWRGGDKPFFAERIRQGDASQQPTDVKNAASIPLQQTAASKPRKISVKSVKKGRKKSAKRTVSTDVISALGDFYRSHDQSPWETNDGWSTMTSSSLGNGSVHGVTVHDGRALKLNLSSNNLSGPIPPSIAVFTDIQYLYLQRNVLTGAIPSEVFQLCSLKSLILSSNQLNGELPAAVSSCVKLEYLILSDNALVGHIPSDVSELHCLVALDLSGNQLIGPIPDLSDCSALGTLDLSNNRLSGGVPVLSGLLDLKAVDVRHNCLDADASSGIATAAGMEEALPFKFNFMPQQVD
jgi:hypothetical protein